MSAYDSFPKKAETVRYYLAGEKFREPEKTLQYWKDLIARLAPDELERFRELINESLLTKEK